MSAVNGANGSPKTPAKPKHSSQLKEFLALGKKIFQDKEVTDYDQLLENKKELEQKLLLKSQEFDAKVEELSTLQSAKTNEIDSLRSSTAETISDLILKKSVLFEEFEKRVISWDTGKTKQTDLKKKVVKLEEELAQAKSKLESSSGIIEKLQSDLSAHQHDLKEKEKALKATKKDLSSKDRELKGTFKELESTQAELEARKIELGFQDLDDEDLATKFRTLADDCYMIAKRFFCTQLPQEFFSNDFWRELENSGFMKASPKKLPLSNSVPAQCLRMATAETIIADKLCNHIFKKYYLPESSPAQAVLDDVLERLGKNSSKKEAIFCSQLLAAYEPEEQSYVSSLVESTIEEIIIVLNPLLFTPAARENFRSALRKLLDDAVMLWRSIQRGPAMGSVLNDPDQRSFGNDQNQDWDMNEEYDSAVDLAEDQKKHVPDQSEPVISLFPQLSVDGVVICRGCALWSDQNVVVAATIEFSQLNSRNSAQGRGALGRRDSDRRKLSLSGSSNLGRRGEEPPMSPRSPSGNLPFSEHASNYSNNWKVPLPGARSVELGRNLGGE